MISTGSYLSVVVFIFQAFHLGDITAFALSANPSAVHQSRLGGRRKKNVALISIPMHDAVRAPEGNTDMNMSQGSFCHPLENYRSFPLIIFRGTAKHR